MLIGLCGLKGSGKDTVAAYLIKEYGYERRAFADILKLSAAALFGINPAEFEAMKNDETAFVAIGFKAGTEGLAAESWSSIKELSVREFLQRYGTESHRDVFGRNFWVDQILPANGYFADRDMVITDVRYMSEATRIHLLHGFVVRVVRHADPPDSHSSESEQDTLNVDYSLNNTGELKDIPVKVDQMLRELGVRRVYAT